MPERCWAGVVLSAITPPTSDPVISWANTITTSFASAARAGNGTTTTVRWSRPRPVRPSPPIGTDSKSINNNTDGHSPQSEGGGGKWARVNNVFITGFETANNTGPGLWFDINNTNIVLTNSTAHGNHYKDKRPNLEKRPEGDGEIVLGIDAAGGYFINGVSIPGAALEDQLKGLFAARPEDKVLYFRADRDLEYGKIQEAVETARRAGVRVMAAITEVKPSGKGLFEK